MCMKLYNIAGRLTRNYLLGRDFYKEDIFVAMCKFSGVDIEEGIRLSKQEKRHTPIAQYFNSLTDFSAENVAKGWQRDKYRMFRNFYVHRNDDYSALVHKLNLKTGERLLDYGCSISYFTYWISKKRNDIDITLADLPSPTFDFCKNYYAESCSFIDITPDIFPLKENYDVILLLDVFEHVPNPLELAKHLVSHLKPDGRLVETFINDEGHTNKSNLRTAYELRNQTFDYLRENLTLIDGDYKAPSIRIHKKADNPSKDNRKES